MKDFYKIKNRKLKPVIDEYMDGSLYIGLETLKGELYCDVTTNLGGYTSENVIAIEDSMKETFKEIIDDLLGDTGFQMMNVTSGFNSYTTYCLMR